MSRNFSASIVCAGSHDKSEMTAAIGHALKSGYRAFDLAEMYVIACLICGFVCSVIVGLASEAQD